MHSGNCHALVVTELCLPRHSYPVLAGVRRIEVPNFRVVRPRIQHGADSRVGPRTTVVVFSHQAGHLVRSEQSQHDVGGS